LTHTVDQISRVGFSRLLNTLYWSICR